MKYMQIKLMTLQIWYEIEDGWQVEMEVSLK